MKGFINVLDFGAIGDGVSDDTTAIQNALNEISKDFGGTVFFPSGTYVIKAPLALQPTSKNTTSNVDREPSNIHFAPHTEFHLIGSGDARIVAGAYIDNMIHLTYGEGNGDPFYTHIENLELDGRYHAKTGIVCNWSMHVSLTKNKICNVENGVLYSIGYGVARIRDNVIRAKICINFYAGGGDSSIESNNFYPLDNGIAVEIMRGAGNTTIANNIISSEGHANTIGVKLDASPLVVDEIRDLRIRNNEFSGSRWCVLVDGGKRNDRPVVMNILVEGNHITNASSKVSVPYYSQLVNMTDVISPIIINNFLNNPKVEISELDPGILLNRCQSPIIAQNVINFLRGSAIKLINVKYGILMANTMRDNGKVGVDCCVVNIGSGCNYNVVRNNTIIQTNSAWSQKAIMEDVDNKGNQIYGNLISIVSNNDQ